MKFFELTSYGQASEHIEIDILTLQPFIRAATQSEIQFLPPKSPMISVQTTDDCGDEWPDIIVTYADKIFLVSEQLYKVLTNQPGTEQIEWRRISVEHDSQRVIYWLAIIPRIRASTNVQEVEDDFTDVPLEEIQIFPTDIGTFEIFKLMGIVNQTVFITEQLAQELEKHNFENVWIRPITLKE